MKSSKTARAVRTDGNVYDVWYGDGVDFDRDVTWGYVAGLIRKGYTVEVDQSRHCPEGEPRTKTYTPEMV